MALLHIEIHWKLFNSIWRWQEVNISTCLMAHWLRYSCFIFLFTFTSFALFSLLALLNETQFSFVFSVSSPCTVGFVSIKRQSDCVTTTRTKYSREKLKYFWFWVPWKMHEILGAKQQFIVSHYCRRLKMWNTQTWDTNTKLGNQKMKKTVEKQSDIDTCSCFCCASTQHDAIVNNTHNPSLNSEPKIWIFIFLLEQKVEQPIGVGIEIFHFCIQRISNWAIGWHEVTIKDNHEMCITAPNGAHIAMFQSQTNKNEPKRITAFNKFLINNNRLNLFSISRFAIFFLPFLH